MRNKRHIAVLTMLIAAGALEESRSFAQEPALPPIPDPVIRLEQAAPADPGVPEMGPQAASPAAQAQAQEQAVLPSPQGQGFRHWGGNTALARLRNPFGTYDERPRRGLLELGSPQSQVPALGSGPGAAAAAQPSGMPGAPGAAAGAGAGGPGAIGPEGAAAFEAAMGATGPGFGGGAGAAAEVFPMIGDQSPIGFRPMQGIPPPPTPGVNASSAPYPTVRALKISENMSPRPQDRVFFDFNYYNNVNSQINSYDRVPIYHMQAFRYLFGLEKTFNEGRGSIGVRFPINNLTADPIPSAPTLRTPTSTAVGNLDVFAKYILESNPATGSLISTGVLLTTPTGPGRFAGAPYLHGLNDFAFQPFAGYILNRPNWYLQGFSGLYVPTILHDTTYMFNDVGVGYYLLRTDDPNAFLTAFVPTFEVHVNTPFTHRDWHNRQDFAAAPDVVNLTYGLNFQFLHTAILTAAFIHPVTNPEPFSSEVAVLLNIFYGRSRRLPFAMRPPPL